MTDISPGNLAYHLQPLGRKFLMHIALRGPISGDKWTIGTKDRLVAEVHSDKDTRYSFQKEDLCNDPDVIEFITSEGIDITDLGVYMTAQSATKGAEAYSFEFSINADSLLISGAKLESSHELVRIAEVQLLTETFHAAFLEFIKSEIGA